MTFAAHILFSALLAFPANAETKPLFNVNFTQAHAPRSISSSLVVFSDGQFVFDSNAGAWTLCASSKAGRFKGTFKPEEFQQLQSDVENLSKACDEIKTCGSGAWSVRNYANNKSISFASSDQMPKIVGHVLDASLQRSPLTALQLSVQRTDKWLKVLLKNIGQSSLQLPWNKDTLTLLDENGEVIKLDQLGLKNFESRVLKLKPGKTEEITLQIDAKSVKPGTRVLYDNSKEAHHFDEEGRTFLPCVVL